MKVTSYSKEWITYHKPIESTQWDKLQSYVAGLPRLDCYCSEELEAKSSIHALLSHTAVIITNHNKSV